MKADEIAVGIALSKGDNRAKTDRLWQNPKVRHDFEKLFDFQPDEWSTDVYQAMFNVWAIGVIYGMVGWRESEVSSQAES